MNTGFQLAAIAPQFLRNVSGNESLVVIACGGTRGAGAGKKRGQGVSDPNWEVHARAGSTSTPVHQAVRAWVVFR